MRLVAPSILSADFGVLAEEVRRVSAVGADWIHVDVMDGHFVPPLTIGPLVVSAVRAATTLPLDVHLMIETPERQIAEFAKAGADHMTVHVEACPDVVGVLEAIRAAGAKPGLSLNPRTPLEHVRPFLRLVDTLLVMTVQPGWGGQPVFPGSFEKIAAARRMRAEEGASCVIEVDGGVKPANVHEFVHAGADVLVAGSAIFDADDYGAVIQALRNNDAPPRPSPSA